MTREAEGDQEPARASFRRAPGARQGESAGEGGEPVPCAQAAVWLCEGALPGIGEEHSAGADAIGVVESVVGAPTVVADDGVIAPVRRGKPAERRRYRYQTVESEADCCAEDHICGVRARCSDCP